MNFCGGLVYTDDDEERDVYDDLCFHPEVDKDITIYYREYLHKRLDEWLDNSDGHGFFWVGNNTDIRKASF